MPTTTDLLSTYIQERQQQDKERTAQGSLLQLHSLFQKYVSKKTDIKEIKKILDDVEVEYIPLFVDFLVKQGIPEEAFPQAMDAFTTYWNHTKADLDGLEEAYENQRAIEIFELFQSEYDRSNDLRHLQRHFEERGESPHEAFEGLTPEERVQEEHPEFTIKTMQVNMIPVGADIPAPKRRKTFSPKNKTQRSQAKTQRLKTQVKKSVKPAAGEKKVVKKKK